MLYVTVYRKTTDTIRSETPVLIGRAPRAVADKPPATLFAVPEDDYMSGTHIWLEAREDNRIYIENLSKQNRIRIVDHPQLMPGLSLELPAPVDVEAGRTKVHIDTAGADVGPKTIMAPMLTIAAPLRPGVAIPSLESSKRSSLVDLGDAPDPSKLAQWFETVVCVQRAAAGSAEFYEQTAAALVTMVGLDRGIVMLREGAGWRIVAEAGRAVDPGNLFSQSVVDEVVKNQRTYFLTMDDANPATSLIGIQSVVASPIFGQSDEVVGVLYGSLTRTNLTREFKIGPLLAQIVQLLAAAVGAGLARQSREAEVARTRVQFSQFFSPELAQELESNPNLLRGADREVTVLFSDIRGFTGLSERLDASSACDLVNEVMELMTARIRATHGAVVSYLGDGLLAMWNAPKEQPNHAALACEAALTIIHDLREVAERWRERLHRSLTIGIGINTGPARVGNIGSSSKFHYGPLGHVVNVGSRVESVTKYLRVPVLITESTRLQIGDSFSLRRLCKAKLAGLEQPMDLFQVLATSINKTSDLVDKLSRYEQALEQFEHQQFGECCRTLYPLLDNRDGEQQDIPSLDLASRAIECLKDPTAFRPFREFLSK